MSNNLTLYRGETRVLTLTVTDRLTGARVDLSAGTWQLLTCEFQVKSSVEGPDPPLIAKTMSSGVVVLTQTGSTVGQLQVVLTPADTAGVTTPPGRYYYDVSSTFASGVRLYLVQPAICQIRGVVNQL